MQVTCTRQGPVLSKDPAGLGQVRKSQELGSRLSLARGIHSQITEVSKYLLSAYWVPNPVQDRCHPYPIKIVLGVRRQLSRQGGCADQCQGGLPGSSGRSANERHARQGASPEFPSQLNRAVVACATLSAVRIKWDTVQKALSSVSTHCAVPTP